MGKMLLRIHKQSLIAPIENIISDSLNKDVFPDSWKCVVMTPILKSKDPTMTRQISILPSRTRKKLAAKQLTQHLNSKPCVLNHMQFGSYSDLSVNTLK